MSNQEQQQRLQFPLDPNSYKIMAEIGAGGSAVVYKALCLPLNSVPVAIKSIDLDTRRRSGSSSESSSDHQLDEARREAKTMSLLSHPNILTAHCSFAVGRRLWVVMPFMSGGSLASILASSFPSGLPEPAVAIVLRETLNALSYLHAQGHLHRDVKAGNILVDATSGGSIKLADFGVSTSIYDSPFPLTDIAGTPYWMAPEVIHSRSAGYGVKADIWSFGITALELAHGRPPLSNLPLSESLLMKLTKRFQFSNYEDNNDNSCNKGKKFSRAFKEMVGLCLNQEPSKRPTVERLLKHSFFKSYSSSSSSSSTSNKGLDFLVKNVLHGLPSVEERFRVFKSCNNIVINNHINGHDIEDHHNDDDDNDLKEKRRRISGWNFNEDVLELDPIFPLEDDSVVKHVRFGGETLIDHNMNSNNGTGESSPSLQISESTESSLEVGVSEIVTIDRDRVMRDLVSLRRNLEAERKTLAEILRLLGAEEAAETREEYLERAVEALSSELENERQRNSELEMEIEFLKMEIQRS